MNATLIRYFLGSTIAIIAMVISYFVIGTPVAETVANAAKTYCSQPQPDRMQLRAAVKTMLHGISIEVHCPGDQS